MEQEIMQNANFEWLATLFVGIFSAFAGTFLGAVLLNHLQKSNMRKNRGTAVKALKILKKYDTKKYGEAKSQFNIELSISEKRAVLVLLHKMGIPIQIPASNKFDIKDIEFADITIDGKEINGIIDQVKGGYCDMLIFNDVEAYFTSNIRVSAVRNTGEKYVKEVLAKIVGEDVKIIDGGLGTAKELRRRLSEKNLLTETNKKGKIEIVNSSDKKDVIKLSYELLKMN